MNIIFLDVDGVLNNTESLRQHDVLSDSCLANLKAIVDNTGAKIVLSSSWRFGFTKELIPFEENSRKLLEKIKSIGSDIIGKTPDIWDGRGREIENYISNKLTCDDRYIIIDDDDFDILGKLREQLIRTDSDTGLTAEDAKKAIRKLTEGAAQC